MVTQVCITLAGDWDGLSRGIGYDGLAFDASGSAMAVVGAIWYGVCVCSILVEVRKMTDFTFAVKLGGVFVAQFKHLSMCLEYAKTLGGMSFIFEYRNGKWIEAYALYNGKITHIERKVV